MLFLVFLKLIFGGWGWKLVKLFEEIEVVNVKLDDDNRCLVIYKRR